MVPTRAGVLGF
jgi:hypothetical protein